VNTLVQKIDKLPPNLVRVLARDNNGAMSNREIADKAGLSTKRIGQISRLKSWATLPIWEAAVFADACGVDLLNQAKTRKYLMRGPAMAHVQKATNREYLLSLTKL
jgi:hypothetical protein